MGTRGQKYLKNRRNPLRFHFFVVPLHPCSRKRHPRTEKSARLYAELVNGNLENFNTTREHSEITVRLSTGVEYVAIIFGIGIPEPPFRDVEVAPRPV